MRLELLLIFGILFFCCWCAFIVARMNWSVALPAAPEAVPATRPPFQVQNSGQAGERHQPRPPQISLLGQQIDLIHSNNINGNHDNGSSWRHSGHRQPPVNSFARLIEASQPAIRFQEPPLAGGSGPPGQPMPQTPAGHQANNVEAAGAWLPAGHHQWPAVSISAKGQLPINEATHEDQLDELEQANNNNDDINGGEDNNSNNNDTNEQDGQLNGQNDERETGANNEDEEEQAPTDTAGPEQEQEQEQEHGQEDEQREEPARAREKREEVSERRSFSEDVSDNSERDRDGNLVVTNRSHLINGRPVKGGGGQGAGRPNGRRKSQVAAAEHENEAKFDEPDEENEEEEEQENEEVGRPDTRLVGPTDRLAARKREQDREFDKVVSEIDRERDRRRKRTKRLGKQDNGDGQEDEAATAAAATTTTTTTKSTGRGHNSGEGEPTKVISRRMMSRGETSGPTRTRAAATPRTTTRTTRRRTSKRDNKQHLPVIRSPDLHEHSLQETLSAQQWDDDSAGAGGDPSGPGEELAGSSDGDIVDEDEEAQKLEALSRELLASPPAQQPGPEPDAPSTRGLDRRRRQVSSEVGPNRTNERPIFSAPISGNALISFHKSSGPPTSMEAAERNISLNGLAGNKTRDGPAKWPVLAADSADSLIGQEDISIEVLANPAPTGNLSYVYQQQLGSPVAQSSGGGGANTAAPGPLAAPVALAYQPHAATGSFPQIGSPFASGSSQEKNAHKEKKKSVKGMKKRKKSRANMEKYRSAKAHGKKMKSKRKKGKSSKKSHKEDKKYSAKKKHFKGHSGGVKASKGIKADGANKGSDFLKDKGYKKKGFKKVYHKLESGDHKTYFDVFRDKDHKKKWKKFNDKSKYSKHKKWSAGDQKQLKQHKYKLARGKSEKLANYKQLESSKHTKKGHKLKEAQRMENSEGGTKKKKKKHKSKKSD